MTGMTTATRRHPAPYSGHLTASPVRSEESDRLGSFLRTTAQSLEDSVEATLTGNPVLGRRVRRAARVRRSAHDAAEQQIRRRACTRKVGSLTHALAALQCLEEVQRIGDLADSLALQSVRGSGCSALVSADTRESVRSLGAAAAQRLYCLAEGLHEPAMDAAYVRCGIELRRALDCLAAEEDPWQGREGPDQTLVTVCAEVAKAVLAASRHAGRAA